jgi:Fur family peroxide stress response transcriptional regulator
MNDFTNILREHNLKATPQRLEIINTIFLYGHINIDKLYEEVKNKFSSISLATIYKNINAMITNSLLEEVKLPNEKSVYEIIKEKHAHLLCNKCNNIIDVDISLDNIAKDVSSKLNFTVVQSDLVLSGVCQDCK